MAASMKDLTASRILEEMIRPVDAQLKILIVDNLSVRVISSCLKMYNIMEAGVTLVDNVDVQRQPMKEMDAIYFLSPTQDSVQKMIADFPSASKRKYKNAHLFFTSELPANLMQEIGQSPLVHHVKTLKELHIEYLAVEQQCFSLDEKDGMQLFYGQESNLQQYCRTVAKKLATVCIALGENPVIRFSKSFTIGSSSLGDMLSTAVESELDKYYSRNPDALDNSKHRATLLILDRSIDVVSPLLHEFTYQAMCHDLLPIENDVYKYKYVANNGESATKEVLLNETDALWPTLRHMHIADSINHTIENFNDFLASNPQASQGKVGSLAEMGEMIRRLPQYREMLSKYSLHVDINAACMKEFNDQMLRDVGNLEQNMIMGENSEGEKCKSLLSDMTRMLNENMSISDKHRLLMIYIISQEGIKEADRSKLLEVAQVSFEDQTMISNLSLLGVTLQAAKKSKLSKKKKNKKKKARQRDDVPYELSRYIPQTRLITEDLIDGELPPEDFGMKGQDDLAPSASSRAEKGKSVRSHTPKWTKKKSRGGGKEEKRVEVSGPRVIVFVAGGMTYSEMRTAYEVTQSHHREVVIGSTHILTPKSFLSELKKLKSLDF